MKLQSITNDMFYYCNTTKHKKKAIVEINEKIQIQLHKKSFKNMCIINLYNKKNLIKLIGPFLIG